MRRRYFTLDVFTAKRFTGNPLAVVLEPGGLDTDVMQAITREFNLPETVFVFPPDDPGHRARVRIFTPARELAFAGHPTVGTAVLLAHLDGGAGRRNVVLAEGVGPVTCAVEPKGEGGNARFDIPRRPERVGGVKDAGKLAAALGLAPADIGFEGFVPENWTGGNAFTFVPVRGLDAIGRAGPSALWGEAFGPDDPFAAFLFCREVVDPVSSFHARMFAPAMGISEDPATGSAAAAFAGVLAATGRYADGEHAITIEQGCEMGRPSLLRLWLTIRDGAFASAAVGGDAVIVSEGVIEA
jgi:trans-2,3-dihydro-3-hydroxyanthranilate isomerase